MITTYILKFPAVKNRSKAKAVIITIILFALIAAIVINNNTYIGIAIGIMIICALWYDHLAYSREDPSPYFAEQLTFDIDKIIIGDDVFALEDLENFKLFIIDYDGETSQGRGRFILNGTNNHFSFTYRNRTISSSFYITSEVQKDQFKILFKNWYNNKFSFSESSAAGRTYLLNQLNYNEIQEFKKQYDLK